MKKETLLKIINWATGDDTGSSSEFLCRYMLDLESNSYGHPAPYDADDRGRCIRLLNLIPEWWDRLDELNSLPPRNITVYKSSGLEIKEEG